MGLGEIFGKIQIASYEKSLVRLEKHLASGESIIVASWGYAFGSAKPCILALTASRLIRYRKKIFGEEIISLPLGGITAIDETTGLGTSKIEFYNINGRLAFFPSTRSEHKKRTQQLMNEIKRRINIVREKSDNGGDAGGEDIAAQIRSLAALRDDKIITEQEFQAKKNELMKRI